MPATKPPAINRNRATNRALDPDRAWVRLLRILVGGLAIASVVYNVWRAANGESDNTVTQTLSHYTNLSNLLLGVVFLVGALVNRPQLPGWWDDLRGLAAFSIVMTGIIYAVLVAEPGELARWDLSWTNLVSHRLTPVVGLLGWLVITMTRRGRWWRPLLWLLMPIVWLGYTWVRGAIVDWYPYGFLDPTRDGGWERVLQQLVPVIGAFLAVAVVLHLLGNARAALAHRPTSRS